MSHSKIYDAFQDLFPNYINEGVVYFPTGKNSIRLRGVDGYHLYRQELVFTYFDKRNWRLETVDQFIKRMSKGD